VEIRPRVSGYINQISFKDGQLVKPGDVLFMIDPRPYQDALDQANAQPNPRPPEHRHSATTGKVARFLVQNLITFEVIDTFHNIDSLN